MNLWQCRALWSLVFAILSLPVFAQDGLTVFIGKNSGLKIKAPAEGAFHSAFVDTQDNVPSSADLLDKVRFYENQTGLKLQLVTIQSHWRQGFQFPLQAVQDLYDAGYLALVRLHPGLSTKMDLGIPDPIFNLKDLARGSFDVPLRNMLQSIATLKGKDGQIIPLMIAFAPEPNAGRYRHSGVYYGAGQSDGWGDPAYPDGPEIYRDAYRHLIELARRPEINALNITWALHLSSQPKPVADWNAMARYYPGDDYIDWLGLTVLGAQDQEMAYPQFAESLLTPTAAASHRWSEFLRISSKAHKGLFKFNVSEDPNQVCRKADWLTRALQAIPSQFKEFKLINYWHESQGSLRLDSTECAVNAYRQGVAARFFKGRWQWETSGSPTPEAVPQVGTVHKCEQDIRSFNGPVRLQATFQGTASYDLFWIDSKGQLVSMGKVNPGRKLTLSTTAGHVFLVQINGRCVAKVQIGLANNIFSVGS